MRKTRKSQDSKRNLRRSPSERIMDSLDADVVRKLLSVSRVVGMAGRAKVEVAGDKRFFTHGRKAGKGTAK